MILMTPQSEACAALDGGGGEQIINTGYAKGEAIVSGSGYVC